jgi:NADH-quinone oxidoreductase subunit A
MTVEYIYILIFFVGAFLISTLLIFLSYFLVYQESDLEKNSAYECGFQPFEDTRSKFNVRYYLIAILFMIFDLEIMYLFPWSISISTSGFFGTWAILFFLVVLTVGFIYEWQKGALEWD